MPSNDGATVFIIHHYTFSKRRHTEYEKNIKSPLASCCTQEVGKIDAYPLTPVKKEARTDCLKEATVAGSCSKIKELAPTTLRVSKY